MQSLILHLITIIAFLSNILYAEGTNQSDIDSIKSAPIKLLYGYYTANSNTADGKLRWYISATGGGLNGYIFSLGDIETINGVEKVSWREVSNDAASMDLVGEKVVIGDIADNPDHTFKDWGLGVNKNYESIQEDIELIRNSTVNIRWWFFQAPNDAWYIIDKQDHIYKFETKDGEYDWQQVDTSSFDMEFYMSGSDKMIKPIVAPTLSPSLLGVSEDASTGDTLTGSVVVSYDGGREVTAMTLSGNGSENFEINASGVVKVKAGATLDYETTTEYNLTAIATNSIGDSEPVAVNIMVNNVTDTVAILTPTAIEVADAQVANSVIGNVTIVDSGDSAITAMTLNGTNAGDFTIETNGVIKTAVEMNASNIDEYNLTVVATNGAGDSLAVDVNITVTHQTLNSLDADNDNIPDSIEAMLGMDANNGDEDEDGVLDGLQLSGDHGDTFFDKQWHIKSLGTTVNGSGVETIADNDLDLMDIYHNYMGYNNGTPIIIQVVDNGVDADHEDLVDNMDLSRSYKHTDTENTIDDPSPDVESDTHGTEVAGIMAARAFNGKGVRGIIPFAKIAGSNWIEHQTYSGLEKAWYSGEGANEIAVTNNSWGAYISNETAFENLMKNGTTDLRDGKGRIYVFAAGNEREDAHGNSNLDYLHNNRYAIAVAALKHDNTYASYSSPGGNVLISGYSGNYYQDSPTIGTTTVEGQSSNSGDINEKTTWDDDTAQDYTFAMNGTSAASPTVAASIALVLEACPDLTWRDMKYLVAKHGKKVDSANSSWQENGGGLWYSVDYGYGLINPKEMITDCNSSYTPLGALKEFTLSDDVNASLADNDSVAFDVSVDNADSMIVEWIDLTIDSNTTQASDYVVELTSPSGAKHKIVDYNNGVGGGWMDGGFKFGVAGFVDENSSGTWRINIADIERDADKAGTIKNITIKFYGH